MHCGIQGEILDAHCLPCLWRFAEEEEKLLQLRPLAADALEYATMFYRDGDRDDEFHNHRAGLRSRHVNT